VVLVEEVEFIWLNGKFVPWKEAKLHFLTHSLHYGTAVFEGIRCYKTEKGPTVFRLRDHVKRLFNSAKIAGMKDLPFSEQKIIDATKQLIQKNNLQECYIRPLFFYGYGKMGLDTRGAKVEAGIAAWPWGAYLGEEGTKRGVRATLSPFKRHANQLFAKAKVSGVYANSTLAKMDALNKGFDEAIMLDSQGNVSECTGENIFLVSDGKLFTPEENSILLGITRDSVMQLAKDKGFEVEECQATKEMLFKADECFITGTAAEITPIVKVDGKAIGSGKPGAVTKKMQKDYDNAVHGRLSQWSEWLDFV